MERKSTVGQRLTNLFKSLDKVDAVFLFNSSSADPNFTYFSSFKSGIFEDTFMIITRKKMMVFTSSLEYGTAVAQKKQGMEIIKISESEHLVKQFRKHLSAKNIGVNGRLLPMRTYMWLKKNIKPKTVVDVSEKLEEARLIKTKDEIEILRTAINITKAAMIEIEKHLVKGMTEIELAAKFGDAVASLGASGLSFPTIVCFGKNAAEPHHMPDATRLVEGDLILVDAGAKVDNYCADITRTFFFGDNTKHALFEMYNIVKVAQYKAINSIKPGINGSEVHAVAEEYINNASSGKYRGKFTHSLGHSIGVEVHDGKGFSSSDSGSANPVKPGMVITVEPGIYVEGLGGVRIEDDVLVTENGCEVL